MSAGHLHLTEAEEHPTWGGSIRTSIHASVGKHYGTKPHRFRADCYVDFSDVNRTQCSVTRLFDTEAAAEEHARLFWSVMLPLWRDSLRTHAAPDTPFARRGRACKAHVAEVTRGAREAYELADREARGGNRRPLWAERDERRLAWIVAVSAAERRFYEEREWTEYIDAPAAPAGQLALFRAAP